MRARLRKRIFITIPLVAVGLVAVFAVVGVVSTRGLGGSESAPETLDGSITDVASTEKGLGQSTGDTLARTADGQTEESEGDDATSTIAASAAAATQKLVRNGQLSLLLPEGKLIGTIERITAMTTGMGGYVMSSSIGGGALTPQGAAEDTATPSLDRSTSSAEGPVAPSQAWLTLRVPQRRFDAAVAQLSELGEVTAVSTWSEDVTAQYVDVQAQLRHNRAVERRLLRFLAETDTIQEMLAVQDRINAVQLTIEQLEAQLKSLRETTTFATLSVSLDECGAPQPGQIDDSDTFAGVFWNSLTLLGRGARLTALAVTAALPFLVVFGALGAGAWYAIRRLRGHRRTEESTTPA